MDAIKTMMRETKLLRRADRRRIMDEITDRFPNANESRVEDKVDEEIKEHYVDTFTQLLQNNLAFCLDLMKSDLGKRVSEQYDRLIHQEDVDSDDDEGTMMDAVTLCRPYIEELF